MTIPQAVFFTAGDRPFGPDKAFSDDLAPVKTTIRFDIERYTRDKIAALVESFPTPTKESRTHDETFSDALAPSKTTVRIDYEQYSQNKTAALTEVFPTPTKDSRTHDEVFSDAAAPSKTTNEVDTQYPKDLDAVQDEEECPSIVVDLTWDVGSNNTNTMLLERKTSGAWGTIDATVSAGTEYYEDTGATVNTTEYRIKFNVAGSSYDNDTIEIFCPE